MNILVPTDFSEIANVAIRYAAMLARKLDAKILLFHAVPHHSAWWAMANNELVLEAHRIQKEIKEELLSAGVSENKIEMHVFYQFPLNVWINDFIRKNKIDFAVIGTKGVTGLENVMLGSFALGMIDNVSIPVIAVPPNTNAENINSILYPTDLEHPVKEAKELLPFVKALDTQLHIVYISKDNMGENLKALERLRKMAAKLDFEKVSLQVKRGNDLPLIIAETIKEKQADLLAMFSAPKGYFEQLIRGSVTEETSYHIDIPLLIIKKK